MFFHDRARGEAEYEIMKKTFYNVGYNMVWLLTYFQIFFKIESSSFSEKLDSNFTQFTFNDLRTCIKTSAWFVDIGKITKSHFPAYKMFILHSNAFILQENMGQ